MEFDYEESKKDKPHCHAYFQSEMNDKTIRSQLRKMTGGGNGAYSLKEVDIGDDEHPIEYIAYMMKEDTDAEFVGIDDDTMDKARMYDEIVKKQLKEKKLSKKTQLQQVEEYVSSQHEEKMKSWTLGCWVRATVEWYKETGNLIREFQVQCIANTLCLKYNEEYLSTLSNRILQKMEKN